MTFESGDSLSAISNQQSAISNQQAAISKRQAASTKRQAARCEGQREPGMTNDLRLMAFSLVNGGRQRETDLFEGLRRS